MGDESVSEEVVHLAAGMLSAGYRGVVATMWSIQDKVAPVVAGSFYKELIRRSNAVVIEAKEGVETKGTVGRLNGVHAAASLRHAIRDLRKDMALEGADFLAWVPYVHFGL